MPNYTTLLLTVAAALTAGTLLAAPAAATPAPATPDCPDTLVLGVDGTKGPTTRTSLDPRSPLNAFTEPYRTQPGTAVEHIEYPGGMVDGVFGWDADFDESIEAGASALRNRIALQEKNCGRTTHYVLMGFSQGSLVVRQVATEIDSDRVYDDGTDLQDRTQVVLVADPAAGVASRAPENREILPGITLPEPAEDFEHLPAESLCQPGDLVCDPSGTLVGYLLFHNQSYRPGN